MGRTLFRRGRAEPVAFVDGFVAAVPTAREAEYRAHAEKAAAVFKDYGALEVIECWGEEIADGERTSFIKAVACESDETVVFSWVRWPSREVRDAAMVKVAADPRLSPEANPMPFDGTRLIHGGFVPIVEA